MRKLLMRGGLSPLESPAFLDIVDNNLLGYNAGNLIYAFSVTRALMTEGTQIDVDHYLCERNKWTPADIERINATYDAYIIPLADAFRSNFASCLNAMAANMRRLSIPCYVIGVGLKAPLGVDLDEVEGFPCDKAVKNFVSAALERSALVGLRGPTTGRYLQKLGFAEGTDYTVIGCPSLYGFGRELKQRPLNLNPASRVSVNFHPSMNQDAIEFLIECARGFERGQYVAQREVELYTLYAGVDNTLDASSPAFPARLTHPLYEEDRVRFFLSAEDWIAQMRTVDLSIGGRLHGTVAAILGGAPVVFAPCDARTAELQAYHAFPTISQDELHPGMALEDVLERVDLQSHLRRQPENFDHYLDFLAANGIENIFAGDPCRADAPLDALLAARNRDRVPGSVTTILGCSQAESISRLNTYLAGEARRQARRNSGQAARETVTKATTQKAIDKAAEKAADKAAEKAVSRALAAAKNKNIFRRAWRKLRRLFKR